MRKTYLRTYAQKHSFPMPFEPSTEVTKPLGFLFDPSPLN